MAGAFYPHPFDQSLDSLSEATRCFDLVTGFAQCQLPIKFCGFVLVRSMYNTISSLRATFSLHITRLLGWSNWMYPGWVSSLRK
jgi:hypothetical protein